MKSHFVGTSSMNKLNAYTSEMVELYNENYLGDDYELRKVEQILGRRIRVFPRGRLFQVKIDGEIAEFYRESKSYNKEFELLEQEFGDRDDFVIEYLIKWEGLGMDMLNFRLQGLYLGA